MISLSEEEEGFDAEVMLRPRDVFVITQTFKMAASLLSRDQIWHATLVHTCSKNSLLHSYR